MTFASRTVVSATVAADRRKAAGWPRRFTRAFPAAVVDPVACHGQYTAFGPERLHDLGLVLRKHLGADIGDAEIAADAALFVPSECSTFVQEMSLVYPDGARPEPASDGHCLLGIS